MVAAIYPSQQAKASVRFTENISVPLADTEQSFMLPPGTKRFMILSRLGGTLRLADGVGETSTKYLTIFRYVAYSEGDINLSNGKTLYFRSSKASDVVEIVYWT